MRALSAARRGHDEEEESVFISMTDMTVSFLFIVMILLAFFASQFRPDEQVPLVDYEQVVAERELALEKLSAVETNLREAEVRISELKKELSQLKGQLATLRNNLKVAEVKISQQTAELEIRAERIAAQEQEILNLETTLKESLAELARLKSQLEALRNNLTLAEGKIEQQATELDARAERIAELEAKISRLTVERDTLRLALAKAESARDEALTDVAQQEDRISALEAEIEALSEELARLRQPDPLEAYMAQVSAQREQVLNRLRDILLADFPELEGVITSESDVLRFQGEGLFASGSDRVLPERIAIIQRIAERMDDLLPCYTLGERAAFSESCNPAFAIIEAVQIEGHTDSDGDEAFNVALSARRGAATYATMTTHMNALSAHRNLNGQPVLSIAGYGEGRPVAENETAAGKSTNRRIDLRFIMVTPGKSEDIARIRSRLRSFSLPAVEP